MKDILNMMNSDYNATDQLFARLNGKSKYPDVILHELKNRLKRHFAWEEQVLFPEYEKKAGAMGKQIVSRPKGEHQHIQNVLIEDIEKQINSTSTPDAANTLSGLIEILQMHKEMEQDIFYPWFEKNLNGHEINQLVERLKNKYLIEFNNI